MPKIAFRKTAVVLVLLVTILLLASPTTIEKAHAVKGINKLSGAIAFKLEGGSFTAVSSPSLGGGQPNTSFDKDINLSEDPPAAVIIAQTEPAISVSPVDRDNLVVGFHDPFTHPERPGEIISCAFTTSFDGGRTWTKFGAVRQTMPLDSCSDPALTADFRGDFYYAYLSVRDGCFALGPCTSDITVSKSIDHGRSFGAPVIAFRGELERTFPDKEYVAADSFSGSPYRGNVYVTFTLFDIVGPGLSDITGCRIIFARSTNGGQSFQPAVQISPKFNCSTTGGPFGNVVQGSMPAVGPDGSVYVAYYDSTEDGWGPGLGGAGVYTPMIARSVDGGTTFSKPIPIATLNELDFVLAPTVFRAWSSMFPIIAVAYDHIVYVVTATNPTGPDDADIVLVKSGNRGKTWDTPARVNDDSTTNDQFFAWVATQPDGTVHVIFGDRRDDPNDQKYHIYYTELSKGSGRFRSNLRVSDAISNPARRALTFIGDYFSIAASDTRVHVTWTDTRSPEDFPDIFVDRGITPVHGG